MTRAARLASERMRHRLQPRQTFGTRWPRVLKPVPLQMYKYRDFPKSIGLVYGEAIIASVGTPTESWHLPIAGLSSRSKMTQECMDGSSSS